MNKNLILTILLFIPSLLVAQSYLVNGGFENGIDENWTHSAVGADASFAVNSVVVKGVDNTSLGPREGSKELKIDLTAASADKYAVSSSTTVTVGNDSIYLLKFWARESEFFEYDSNQSRGGKTYTNNPDFARMIVKITTESGQKYEVLYALRYGPTTFHLPFKSFDKQFTISFHPQTAGRQYFIDGIELLDQSRNGGLDVLNTYRWNNQRSTVDGTWLAGDNDVSFELPDGRTMWFFNDSFDGAANDTTKNILDPIGGFIRNACVIQDKQGNLVSLGGKDSNGKGQSAFFEIIPGNEIYNAGGGQVNCYWVGDAILEGDKVKVYLIEVFGEARSAIAEFSYPNLELLDIKEQADIGYGYETFIADDGIIYLYRKKDGVGGLGVNVARTTVGNLIGDETWEYWNGSSWITDPTQSVTVLKDIMPDGVVKLQDNNYAMVSGMSAIDASIEFSFAPAPQGPWTSPQTVYTRPDDYLYWAYMPNIHEQLENGNYSVSYSSNAFMPLFFSTWSFAEKYWYRQRYIQVDLLGLSPHTVTEPNIALNKTVTVSSTEGDVNVGSKAVDGNVVTFWASQNNDVEWLYVDLEQTYDISKIKIHWGNALANNFMIEVSDDASTWKTIKNQSNNIDQETSFFNLRAIGRYIRVKCINPLTVEGCEINELIVNGKLHTSNLVPLIEITSPANGSSFTDAESITFEVDTYDPDGFITRVDYFNGDALLGTANTSPFTLALDNLAEGNYNITAITYDNSGATTTSKAIELNVISLEEMNLALNKPATVSSTEAGTNYGNKAVDGDYGTRWSSEYSDPQWIYVDLKDTYLINRVKITWEAAYGSAYKIQLSDDASNWVTIQDVSGNSSLENEFGNLTGAGRYLRIYGTARGTWFGYSIFELEAYGSKVSTGTDESKQLAFKIYPNPVDDWLQIELTNDIKATEVIIYNSQGAIVYNGFLSHNSINVGHLQPGLYFLRLEGDQADLVTRFMKR
nr:discoidin domain-containing protein [uncultured Carboxylicivirga sp.]